MEVHKIEPWIMLGLIFWALPLLGVKTTPKIKLIKMTAGFSGLGICFLLNTFADFGYIPLVFIATVTMAIVASWKATDKHGTRLGLWSAISYFSLSICSFMTMVRFEIL